MATIIKKVSERITWDAIQKDVDEGKAGEYQVGTIVIETLKNGRKMPYAVAAVNHYQQDELIFINTENYGNHCMNKTNTNEGGWNKSEMRRHANEDILALLPDDMAAVIAPRTIIENGDHATRIKSIDKLWGLSTMEVGDKWYASKSNRTDRQLPYFKDKKKRILKDTDGKSVCEWWTRLPMRPTRKCNLYGFCFVGTRGTPNGRAWARASYGVCLGFAIRKS